MVLSGASEGGLLPVTLRVVFVTSLMERVAPDSRTSSPVRIEGEGGSREVMGWR